MSTGHPAAAWSPDPNFSPISVIRSSMGTAFSCEGASATARRVLRPLPYDEAACGSRDPVGAALAAPARRRRLRGTPRRTPLADRRAGPAAIVTAVTTGQNGGVHAVRGNLAQQRQPEVEHLPPNETKVIAVTSLAPDVAPLAQPASATTTLLLPGGAAASARPREPAARRRVAKVAKAASAL